MQVVFDAMAGLSDFDEPLDIYPIDPKHYAWNNLEFRKKAKVGDKLSDIKAEITCIHEIRSDGLVTAGYFRLVDTSDPDQQHLVL